MASIKIDLSEDTWSLLGGGSIVAQASGNVQIVNADAAPTGVQEASIYIKDSTPFVYPAPAAGDIYAKGSGSIKYYAV